MKKYLTINGDKYEVLKPGTKKAQNLITNYNNSSLHNLWWAYGRPSYTKLNIWKKWHNKADKLGGYNMKVTTYCKMFFTLGFEFNQSNGHYLAYITPSHNYLIKIGEGSQEAEELTPEQVKKEVEGLNPIIREKLAQSAPICHNMEQVNQLLKISKIFSVMVDMCDNDKDKKTN